MNSPAIDNEKIVSEMMAALAPLSDEWLQYKQSRLPAYAKHGISKTAIDRFDRTACRREVLRRQAVGPVSKKTEAA